jgi:hypothetical protein
MDRDIRCRLKRITARIQEHEAQRAGFAAFTGRDTLPSAPANKDLRRLEDLYVDNMTFLLSELVHLRDNVGKWIKASHGTQEELPVVEDLKPFRVASCYVNTHKHGVRGRNKASAVEDVAARIYAEADGQVSRDSHIVDVVPMIDYEGEVWQKWTLVDDLMQLWELFLRNHTDVDTTEFRVELRRSLLCRQQLSEYSFRVPTGIISHLKGLADDRKHLDV